MDGAWGVGVHAAGFLQQCDPRRFSLHSCEEALVRFKTRTGDVIDRKSCFSNALGKALMVVRHMLSLERPKTYDPYTGEDADKLVLRVAKTNLPGPKPTIHMQWREGMLELADAPPSLRQRFPLSTSEKADLDMRVLDALKYIINKLGGVVLADPIKPASLYQRLRKEHRWQHVAPADLEGAIDRLIHRGQVIVDKDASPAILKPAG